ncbi:Leukotriene-B4 omega-hydroxylase 3 [Vanrija pseudolonga]|uniref:Leukotriene-B4 omega-hydroxylase 3 n=1 Tax=Vanrija pseudolonga TaxID=143232 RepID=A0AAF1BMV0_9TREE|nr:Leukotriene-B4 omega-hydroxylase 3 [Vanrija pseudolonga]
MSAAMLALPGLGTHLADLSGAHVVIALLLVLLSSLYLLHRNQRRSALSNLPGPPSASWVLGNAGEMLLSGEPGTAAARWLAEHGGTISYASLLGTRGLATTDLVALAHITRNAYEFVKPRNANALLGSILGDGILTAEGSAHRRQRRVLNPAFGPGTVRAFVPAFLDTTRTLARKWAGVLENGTRASYTLAKEEDKVPGAAKIDVLRGMNELTLDVLGTTVFGVDFGALADNGTRHELAQAYGDMAAAAYRLDPLALAETQWGVLKLIPSKRRRMVQRAHATAARHGAQLLSDARAALAAESKGGDGDSARRKDLLSLLLRANTDAELRADQRLSDDEVLAQMTTFLFAGHETTAGVLAFALARLAEHQGVQDKLFAEVEGVGDEPDHDTLNALPYLDAFVREVLRLDGPVTEILREPARDVELPLASPVVGRDGRTMASIHLRKGDEIYIPIYSVNRSEAVWGDDAKLFNPERHVAAAAAKGPGAKVPGVWGNLLSFYGGARNCVGYRFAVVEMKAILFVLVRSFAFAPLPSRPRVRRDWMIVVRPVVEGEEGFGPQMPLLVTARE